MISDNIFRILKEKEITQKELSDRTGISPSTISDWKHKGLNPASDKILAICNALGVTPYELLMQDGKEQTFDILIRKGSEEYEVLVEFRKMKKKQKERLMGYIEALNEGKK